MRLLCFKHVGVAVADFDQALDTYGHLLGYRLLSGPFNDPIQKVRVCFIGERESDPGAIELVSPLSEDSPIFKILAKGGGGLPPVLCDRRHGRRVGAGAVLRLPRGGGARTGRGIWRQTDCVAICAHTAIAGVC